MACASTPACAPIGVLPSALRAPSALLGSADWPAVWRELEELARRKPGTPEFRELAGGLAAVSLERAENARKQKDKPELFRARVLGAQIAVLAGSPWKPVPEPGADS